MFKVNNKDVFIVNFEHITHLVLVLLLLHLNRFVNTDCVGNNMWVFYNPQIVFKCNLTLS